MADEGKASSAREIKSKANGGDDYWQWDSCRWGTHRVNCSSSTCPYRVYVKDGKVIREEVPCTYPPYDDPDFRIPDPNPRGCQKGVQHSRAMYGPDRLLHPMKRTGERGSGQWEQIGWEQAFDEIGAKLADVIAKHGANAILEDHGCNGAGVWRGAAEGASLGIVSLLGGITMDMNFTVGDFKVGQWLALGSSAHTPGVENWYLADTLIVLSNPAYSLIPDMHYVLEARYRGAKVIAVAPDKNASCQFADLWIPIDWSADPALWLGVCKILLDNGWVDTDFMKEQTDLPILVRVDNKRYLREADLKQDGDAEQFYVADAASGALVDLPKGTLERSCDYSLEARQQVRLADGKQVEVTTIFNLLRERLAEYTPQRVHEMAGVHPRTLQEVAELCRPPRKVFFNIQYLTGKLYHGDLLERSFCYLLALTGNFGKPGTGIQGESVGTEGAAAPAMVQNLPREILEADDPMGEALNFQQLALEDYKLRRKMDPTMPPAEAAGGLVHEMAKSGSLKPPTFYWYKHAGYKDVWDKYLDDPLAPKKKISEYAEDALKQGWWDGFDFPVEPKALIVAGGNALRRHRGGMNTLLKHMWPKFELIVTLDPRWSTTALFSDYALPAASFYEYADVKYSVPDTRFLIFTDQSVPMLGDSRSDRQICHGILHSLVKHLKAKGIEKYKKRIGGDGEVIVDDLVWRATLAGRFGDSNEEEEQLVDVCLKKLGEMGWLTSVDGDAVSLENMRNNGMAWLSGRAPTYLLAAEGCDINPGQVLVPLQDQVDMKVPYATTTRRIQFYLDHPYFIEADEHLVCYKPVPFIGGHQPLRVTSGHVRWSIHANWHASEEMLKLHRGEPFAFVNNQVAAEKGVGDNDYIRLFNDYGSCILRAKLTACVRPDQVIVYHAWEPYQHPDWMPYDAICPGPPKGTHFAGGYRHFEYTLFNWSPYQVDRQTNATFERSEFQG